MYIVELKEGELDTGEEELVTDLCHKVITVSDARRALIGAGARLLFYPTLLYNVLRNKIQSEFRWWDGVGEFILLGAVPFPTDVPRLKQLGVHGVITLNEPYETLVPTSLYHSYNIDHLVIPTRDYLFAPSLGDISKAVEFIHKNASCEKRTYVHCKAGRGRSTTVVLCYLVQHKHMTPAAAYEYVRSIRPRVLLASSQWQAVQEYYRLRVKNGGPSCMYSPIARTLGSPASGDLAAFDDGSVVVVTESDLDGYVDSRDSNVVGNEIWAAELNLICRVQFAGQAAVARLSCLWFRCHTSRKISAEKLSRESSCSVGADQLGGLGVDIRIYKS